MAVAFIILFVSTTTLLKFCVKEAEKDWSDACQAPRRKGKILAPAAVTHGKIPISAISKEDGPKT